MAWQLIYTSAPRLLEAGRTGFGTVARHRAVSGMLASTVERFSQFARLPGHDPRRVVHTYRVLTVAGASYHVFTRLKDAGSDYTGRTNHLAQHVIAEAREIRALAASGLTPADVLLAIPWRESWTEGPRFLDPSEEIDLSNFPQAASSAWAAITGNPASARLLGTPQALKGCYLILPPEARALELFREAMIEAPQGGWQTSLTTSLEPNDEVGDFRWIGLPFDSPLRPQAEVSNRLLLDLTQPAKLPAPPEPPAKVHLPEPERVASATTQPPEEIRSPNKVSMNRPPVQTASVSQMGGWSPEPARPSTKKKSKTLLRAFAAVSLVSASMAGFFMWQHFTATKENAAFQDQIKQVWDKHGLVLKNTRKSLSDEPDLEKGRALLRSLDAYVLGILQVLKNADLKGQPPTPEDTQNLPDFEGLRNAFDTWRQIHGEASASSATKASELLQSYEEWLEKRAKSWANLSDQIKEIGSLPKVDHGTHAKFVNDAKELLRKMQPDKLDMSTWEQLNERLDTDSEIAEWLRIWSGLNGDRKVQIAEIAQTNGLLPEWLKTEARKVLEARDKTLAEKTAAERKAMVDNAAKTANTQKQKIEDADSLDGTRPIVIFNSTNEAILTTEAKIEKPDKPFEDEKNEKDKVTKVHLYVGGLQDRNPIGGALHGGNAGELREWKVVSSTDTKWKFAHPDKLMTGDTLDMEATGKSEKAMRIARLPDRAKDGLRIVARQNDDKESMVLFDVRVLVNGSSGSIPIWATPVPVEPVTKDGAILLQRLGTLLARIRWVNATTEYKLRRNGPASEQKTFDLDCNKDGCIVVPPKEPPQLPAPNSVPTSDVAGQIRSKEQEITTLEKEVQRKTKGSQEKLDKAKEELKQLQARLAKAASQQQTPPQEPVRPPFSLPPGDYTVLRGAVEICTFNLPNGSEDHNTKSTKP